MRILSVCPSVYLSVCLSNAWIVTKGILPFCYNPSVQIFIPYQKSFSLVFGEEEWLVGRPLLPEILGQPAPIGPKSLILNR